MSKQIEVFIDELFVAIEEHNLRKAKECIEVARYTAVEGEVFNSEKYDMKPISFAVKKNSLKILRLLVNNGADVNTASDVSLRTALHVAAKYGREEAGQFLLGRLADVDLRDARGKTSLYLASFHCRLGMVRLLIDNNANTDIKDVDGNAALDVVGDDPEVMCNNHIRRKIVSMLRGDVGFDYKAILPTRNLKVALEAIDTTDVANSAVKPSSFINSMLNWVGASTTAVFGQSTPALPSAQQPVTHSAGSSISSSQVNVNGTTLLADIVIRRFTGEKYSKPIDDSLLTLEQIKERKVSAIERNVKMAISEFEKLYQCPGSSLSNTTISKGINHQKFF